MIAVQAVRRLIDGGHVGQIGVGIAVTAVAAAAKFVASMYLARVAGANESAALDADAAHLRTDALVSLGVLGSLVLVSVAGAEWVDPWLA